MLAPQVTLLGTPYRLAFYLWRRLPATLRDRINNIALLRSIKDLLRNLLAKITKRDDIYSATYYTYVDLMSSQISDAISQMIVDLFQPTTVIDVGCGTGTILLALRRRGVEVYGSNILKSR